MNMSGLSIPEKTVLDTHHTRDWANCAASLDTLAEQKTSAPSAMLQNMWDSLWQGLIIAFFGLDRLLFVHKFLDPWQTARFPHQICLSFTADVKHRAVPL